MGPLSRPNSDEQLALSGELLDIVALDRNGLIVSTEGALVRIVEVTPRNPRVMGIEQQERVAEGFAAMAGRLRVGQSLQFYVDATPILLDDVIATQRQEIDRALEHHSDEDAAALRELGGAHEASLRAHASQQAAVRFRAYVIAPYVPPAAARRVDWDALRPKRRRSLAHASLTRALADHERVARESLVHTENIVSDLEALDLATQLLAGPEVAELLYRRFNPSTIASGHFPRLVVLGELDQVCDARAGRRRRRAAARADRRVTDRLRRQSLHRRRAGPRARALRLIGPGLHRVRLAAGRDGDRPPVRAQRPRPRARPPPGAHARHADDASACTPSSRAPKPTAASPTTT